MVNLPVMRQASLLGKDSFFGLQGNRLLIRAHGAPSIINYMDSIEFANVVRGLVLRAENSIDLRRASTIELQSCFGAFGRYPSGQILANELGKKVTAYPLTYSEKIAQNPEWWRPYPKTFMPSSDFNFTQQWLVNQQHMRNYNFWNKLLGLYKKVTMINSRIVRAAEQNKADSIIESLTHDIAELVLKKISIDDFLQLHAEYYSDGLTEVPPAAIKLALETLLAQDIASNEQSFAEQIIAVFSLNRYSFQLLDNYLSNI